MMVSDLVFTSSFWKLYLRERFDNGSEIKLKIFETLVEVPDGRSRLAVKEFLQYYNP